MKKNPIARKEKHGSVNSGRRASKRGLGGSDVWIALLKVAPSPVSHYRMDGAYVNGVVRASTRRTATARLRSALKSRGFKLIAVKNCDLLTRRLRKHSVARLLLRAASNLRRQGQSSFGTFHSWPGKQPTRAAGTLLRSIR